MPLHIPPMNAISLDALTSFDIIVLLILLVSAIRGVWIGFMRQLAAFLALIGSYILAGRYSGKLMPAVDRFIDNPKLVFLVSFVLLFLVTAIVFILAGKVMHRVMEITLLGWFDRLMGLLLGVVKGAVLASFLYMVLSSSLAGTNTLLQKSLASPYLAAGARQLNMIIHDQRLRQYFLPRKPAIPENSLPAPSVRRKAV